MTSDKKLNYFRAPIMARISGDINFILTLWQSWDYWDELYVPGGPKTILHFSFSLNANSNNSTFTGGEFLREDGVSLYV